MESRIITKRVVGAAFSFYTTAEIRSMSVRQISSTLAFDHLKQPILNGLYDPSMGPIDKFSRYYNDYFVGASSYVAITRSIR